MVRDWEERSEFRSRGECKHCWYFTRLLIQISLIVIVMFIIFGCTRVEYIDTSSALNQATAIKAVLSDCIHTPVGKVGSTNLSLVKGYIQSTESLLLCQGISLEIIESLDKLNGGSYE